MLLDSVVAPILTDVVIVGRRWREKWARRSISLPCLGPGVVLG